MIQNKNHLCNVTNMIVSHLLKLKLCLILFYSRLISYIFWNCIFNFSPCNYSWICDGIKRDLLSSSSTYVDTMKRVKGEKFQHNFLASLWVFIFFLAHKQIKHSQYSSQTIACATLGPLMPHPCCYSCYMPWDICILIT